MELIAGLKPLLVPTTQAAALLAALLVKGILLLTPVMIFMMCRRPGSAARRHAVWVMAIVALLALPFLSFALPGWHVVDNWAGPRDDQAFAEATTPAGQMVAADARPGIPPGPPELQRPRPETTHSNLRPVEIQSDDHALTSTTPASIAGASAAVTNATPTTTAPPQIQAQQPTTSYAAWFLGLWGTVLAMLLLRLLTSQFSLWLLARRSPLAIEGKLWEMGERLRRELSIGRKVRLHLGREGQIPMTWGLITSHVLLPSDATQWTDACLRSVLSHEMAHVRRWDCQTQLVVQIACALHWMNPWVWLSARQIADERERACDDAALASGLPPAEYAEHLIGIASGLSQHRLAALAMARQLRLAGRLSVILNPRADRRRVTAAVRIATVATLAALVLPIAMLRLGAAAEDETTEAETNATAEETPPAAAAKIADEGSSGPAAELLKAFQTEKVFWKQAEIGKEIIATGDKSTVLALALLLDSPDRVTRCNAGYVLAGLGDERGLEAVIRELKDFGDRPTALTNDDGTPNVKKQIGQDRFFAAVTLRTIGDRRAVPALIDVLNDSSAGNEVASVLGDLGDPRAVPALHEILKRPKAGNRLYAAAALAKLGDPLGLPALIGFLKDADPAQRRRAANLLGGFHDKAAVEALIGATKDESPDVRIEAAGWLGMLADRSAIEALEALIEDDAVLTSGAAITVGEVATRALEQIASQSVQPPADPVAEWSKPISGLEFRLSAPRSEYQAWELPTFDVEVRNVGAKAVTVETIEKIFEPGKRSGLRFYFADQYKPDPHPGQVLVPDVRWNVQDFVGLKPGETQSATVTVAATRSDLPSRPGSDALTAGRYSVGLGFLKMRRIADPKAKPRPGENQDDPKTIRPRLVVELKTGSVTLNVLPPGVNTRKELDEYLKPYQAGSQSILAGFVPGKTTVVEGEPMFATFMVENPGDEPFTFAIGGQQRGPRNNRFKIDVIGPDGKPVKDPGGMDFGGRMNSLTVAPHDAVVETVELLKFRKIEGPGQYQVKCTFDLTPSWQEREKKDDGDKFDVAVETNYVLTVLPRDSANVERVLKDLFARANQTGSLALTQLIDTIVSFGRDAAVDGLKTMGMRGDVEHRTAAARGLGKIPTEAALDALVQVYRTNSRRDVFRDAQLAAITSLGAFSSQTAVDEVIQALTDSDKLVRQTAAESLGNIKTEAAITALIGQMPHTDDPEVRAAILRAMGTTRSPRVFEIIAQSLSSRNGPVWRAALDAIAKFPAKEAAAVLRPYAATDQDFTFREAVIEKLAKNLKQPIEMDWLTPIIKSRKGASSLGAIPDLMRFHSGAQGVPVLLSCLDFENPAVRGQYNRAIMYAQAPFKDALACPWNSDLNRDGTAAETEQNRETLRKIKTWVEHSLAHPATENLWPEQGVHSPEEQKNWGEVVDDLRIRAQLHRSIWPEGLPQVISYNAYATKYPNGGAGSVSFFHRPEILELEVDGDWYAVPIDVNLKVSGYWNSYQGHGDEDIQLDGRWLRKSDGRPLELKPGKHTARIAVSDKPVDKRTGLAISQGVTFEVIPTDRQ